MHHKKIFETQAELCRAMGYPLRVEIMHLLENGPLNVNDIVSATHSYQPTISRNLAILRNAGAVVIQRDGNNILYQVASPKLVVASNLMREVLAEQMAERTKLMESYGE